MSDLIHYNACPVCGSSSIGPALNATDNTVSREVFPIWECASCTLRFTQDVPGESAIGPYYKSEDYISHTNTNKGVINRLYHLVRQVTLNNKRNLIKKEASLDKGSLLDIGSGTGAFAGNMQQHGWQVTGLEPDPAARAVAWKDYEVKLEDITAMQQLNSSFDAITLWHVLEHVHALNPYVARLRELLKPAGRIFIAVPNYTSKDAETYGSSWAAYDVPRHLYHFSPASIKVLMEKNGLTVKAYRPMWYDSFYISLLSTRIRDGKTSWAGSLVTGLRSNLQAMKDVKKCSSVIYVVSR